MKDSLVKSAMVGRLLIVVICVALFLYTGGDAEKAQQTLTHWSTVAIGAIAAISKIRDIMSE